MSLKGIEVRLCDLSLHDLMYLRPGRVKLEDLLALACGLDAAGIPLIEFGTSEPLGPGPSSQGLQREDMEACLRAIGLRLKQSRLAIQFMPGVDAAEQLQRAQDWGVTAVSMAASCLDAGLIAPCLRMARGLGLEVQGMLMVAQESEVQTLVQQARLMEAEGAHGITLADCAGTLSGANVREHMQALRQALRVETELGFHGHGSMALSVSNSLAAIEGGARRIDGSLAMPGVRHTPIDALCAISHRLGAVTGVDAYRLSDIGASLVQSLDRSFSPEEQARASAVPVLAAAAASARPQVERRFSGPPTRIFA